MRSIERNGELSATKATMFSTLERLDVNEYLLPSLSLLYESKAALIVPGSEIALEAHAVPAGGERTPARYA